MYGNYLRIFRKISEFFFISEVRTIEPKISEIPELKANGTEILGENFSRIGHISRGCPLFRKFEKILFHSPLKISENLKGIFFSNGKRFWCSIATHKSDVGCQMSIKRLPPLISRQNYTGSNVQS